MKFAGKAFAAGFFGGLGAGVALLGTAVIVVIIGQRQVKSAIAGYDRRVREATESLLKDGER